MRYIAVFGLRLTMVTVLSAFAGCGPPDAWQIFEEDIDRQIDKEYRHNETDMFADPGQLEEAEPNAVKIAGIELPIKGKTMALSVEQAAMLALANNRDLAIRQINPVIAGAFEQIERGRYDPELFAELQHREERISQTARATGEQFSVIGEDTSAAVGILQELPTGTDIEAVVEQERSISSRTPEQQSARLGLSVTQSLLRGLGPRVNLAEVRQAELDTIASVYELRGYTESVLADTEIAYWYYVLARQEIAIFQKSLDIAKEQRDQIVQRIEVGVLPETEAAAARAEVALREQALIEARSELRERRLRLLRLINPLPQGKLDLEVEAVSAPRIEAEAIENLEDHLRLAGEARADLYEARLRLEQARLETVVTRNGLLPRLELFMALGKTGYEDTIGGAFRDLDSETYDVTAGVRFSMLLGNRTAEGRDVRARASRQQALRSIENLRQLARYEVRLAANEVERARQQIGASAATRALQEETLEAERQRFDVGASTALLVAQAQRDLLESRIAEVEAVINYRVALVQLYLAEGSLLERRGVRLDMPAAAAG